MDWANDNACLSQSTSDLTRAFTFEPRPSIVIKVGRENNYQAQIWLLETHEEWVRWLDEHTSDTDRGLVLILADRTERSSFRKSASMPMSIDDWLVESEADIAGISNIRRASTFAQLGEKQSLSNQICATTTQIKKKPRSVRNLPFSRDTFEIICERFQTHKSLIRALTRVDVPSFACENVIMKWPSIVYDCRTPNSWDGDLALSSTYYPDRGLTYGILYGSSFKTEKAILERLRSVHMEAAHPLLLPGIFAELELARHIRIVESSVVEVETKIFELNFRSDDAQHFNRGETDRRNQAKRSAWLDLTYLRNSLTAWSTQLLKMVEHAEWLNRHIFSPNSEPPAIATIMPQADSSCSNRVDSQHCYIADLKNEWEHVKSPLLNDGSTVSKPQYQFVDDVDCAFHQSPHLKGAESETSSNHLINRQNDEDGGLYLRNMSTVGGKIKLRLAAIRDEYDEKIRDCTMRVDGMAMATQWAHSETAVEIALATNQDSKVMRSISLVTMVFLPGTFFATVFSMTFFDWSGKGGAKVSHYLWIYVAVTVCFTAITIGLWYFFVILRGSSRLNRDGEKNLADSR